MSVIPGYCIVEPLTKIEKQDKTFIEPNNKYIFPVSWLGSEFTPEAIRLIEDNVESVWKPYDISMNLDNKKLLIQRLSGFGDFLFLSPLIKYIKEKYPTCKIGVACMGNFFGIFDFIPGVDHLYSVPVTLDILKDYDYHLSVMGIMEGGHEVDDNVYTQWFKVLGIDDIDIEWKRPKISEVEPLKHALLNPEIKYFGIQPYAVSPIRDLHTQMVIDLIPQLNEMGYMPLLFINPTDKRVDNFSKLDINVARYSFEYVHNPSNIQDVIRLAKHCKWFLACDSLFAHMAPALGINTISMYGPFSAGSRVAYYKNSWAIDTQPNCRCRAHVDGACIETNIYPSPCMNVSPKLVTDIVHRIDQLKK